MGERETHRRHLHHHLSPLHTSQTFPTRCLSKATHDMVHVDSTADQNRIGWGVEEPDVPTWNHISGTSSTNTAHAAVRWCCFRDECSCRVSMSGSVSSCLWCQECLLMLIHTRARTHAHKRKHARTHIMHTHTTHRSILSYNTMMSNTLYILY